jgi:ParB family transcriptional regulator, chromosome partitioning protein
VSPPDKRKALGRGLSALIPGAPTPIRPDAPSALKRDFFEAAIEDIHPAHDNPRQVFHPERLRELSESIRQQGVVQPLVVRPRSEGGFTLIAGERRWRAAQLAGLKSLPVVVKDVSGAKAFELTLVENLQREDLNPIEEAEAFQRLIAEHDYTQEQLADRVGKDRTTVANALRLLKLPDGVRGRLASGELAMGHARALLGLESASAMERAAARVVSGGLSVRQTEALVRRERSGPPAEKPKPVSSPGVRDLVTKLERHFGAKVRISQKTPQAGTLEIDYHSLDQLDDILAKILG